MNTPLAIALKNRLTDRTARVGIVGLGYVGLPLLVEFAQSGFEAIGFDLDAAKITAIADGRSYIPDVPDSDVRELRERRTAVCDDGFQPARGCRHDQYIRADSFAKNQRSGHVLRRQPRSRRSRRTCVLACS